MLTIDLSAMSMDDALAEAAKIVLDHYKEESNA